MLLFRPLRVLLAAVTVVLFTGDSQPEAADKAQPKLLQTLGRAVGIEGLAAAPDGSAIATLNMGTVRLWDVKERVERLTTHWTGAGYARYSPLAFSPDGKLLVLGPECYDLSTYQLKVRLDLASEMSPQISGIGSVAISPDGKTLATAGGQLYHFQVKLWDLATGKWKKTLIPWSPGTSFVHSVVFSPDGSRLAADANGAVRVWDTDTGRLLHQLQGPGGLTLDQVVYSPDGHTLAATGYQVDQSRNPTNSVLRLWDAESGRERSTYVLEPYTERRGSYSLAYFPDGKRIAIGNRRVRFLRLSDGSDAGALPEGVQATRLCFLPISVPTNGFQLAVGQENGMVSIWTVPQD